MDINGKPAVPPAPMPNYPEQWSLFYKALPKEFTDYVQALRSHAEALQWELTETKNRSVEWASSKGKILAMYEKAEAELAALRPVADHLRWILPMAKAYAAAFPVGRNQDMVDNAQDALATLDKREAGVTVEDG